jgi:DNA-binding CsgD family transcriptional regulator
MKPGMTFSGLTSLWEVPPGRVLGAALPHIESNPVLQAIFQTTRQIPFLIDVQRMNYRYIGLDPQHWCGWPADALLGQGLASFMNYIHPDDLYAHQVVNECFVEYLRQTRHPEQVVRARNAFEYRLRTAAGPYRRFAQYTQVFETDPDGRVQVVLCLLRDCNEERQLDQTHLRIWGLSDVEDVFVQVDTGGRTFRRLPALSRREAETAQFLLQGLSSQDIAERLFVSKNTIDSHRRHMLRKWQLTDTVELLHLMRTLRMNE